MKSFLAASMSATPFCLQNYIYCLFARYCFHCYFLLWLIRNNYYVMLLVCVNGCVFVLCACACVRALARVRVCESARARANARLWGCEDTRLCVMNMTFYIKSAVKNKRLIIVKRKIFSEKCQLV